jgi:hypothetical protein
MASFNRSALVLLALTLSLLGGVRFALAHDHDAKGGTAAHVTKYQCEMG